MSKQLNFEYKGKQYCLEFNRTTVRKLENIGFNPNDVSEKMMTRLPQLFAGAFMMHHSGIKQSLVNEIYDNMDDKVGFLKCLRAMFSDPYEELLSSPDGDSGNAIKWTANWDQEEEDE